MTIQKTDHVDWDVVRAEYVQGRGAEDGMLERPTLEALAQDHGIPSGTLRNRAAREGWAAERNNFVTLLLQKSREKTLEELAGKIAQTDLQAFSVARASLALLGKQLIEGTRDGTLSLADRERLLRMCDMAHKMARRAAGLGEASD